MNQGLHISNGMPLYIIGKLINDFDPIFCKVEEETINFVGARDHLAVTLSLIDKHASFFGNINHTWNYTYAFKSIDVKTNIEWYRKKNNSQKLYSGINIMPSENEMQISSEIGNATLISFLNNPPIPVTKKMTGGLQIKIMDIRSMVDFIKSIKGENIKIQFYEDELTLRSSSNVSPTYKVRIAESIDDEREKKGETSCLKQLLSISCHLASEVNSNMVELRFYPGGAAQIYSHGSEMDINFLITANKNGVY